jgi:hypothetical protein
MAASSPLEYTTLSGCVASHSGELDNRIGVISPYQFLQQSLPMTVGLRNLNFKVPQKLGASAPQLKFSGSSTILYGHGIPQDVGNQHCEKR